MPAPVTIAWTFTTSKSLNFPLILAQAKLGTFTEQRTMQGKRETVWYSTTFTLSADKLALAQLIQFAKLCRMERRAQALVNGIPTDTGQVLQILECYYRSLSVSDSRAYCWVEHEIWDAQHHAKTDRRFRRAIEKVTQIVTDIKAHTHPTEAPHEDEPDDPVWFFPCRLANGYAHQGITRDHLSPVRAQVDAVLATRGCQWCPSLKLTEWADYYG